MKVKLLSRNPDDYIRETTKDIHKGLAELFLLDTHNNSSYKRLLRIFKNKSSWDVILAISSSRASEVQVLWLVNSILL